MVNHTPTLLVLCVHAAALAGVKSLHLNCSSHTHPGSKLTIGVPLASNCSIRAIMAASIAEDVAEQLARHGKGVSFNPDAAIPCQHAEGQLQEKGRAGVIGALLYFCSCNVHFLNTIIQDVWLPAESGSRIDTAVVYIGGNVDVTLTSALVTGNNASTAVAVGGHAWLTVESSNFTQNTSDPGGAIFSLGSTVLNITNTSFTENHSRDFGGALALMLCSRVSVSSRSFHMNSAIQAGGAVYASGEVMLMMNSSTLQHNSAGSGGAIWLDILSVLRLEGANVTNNTAKESSNGGGMGGGLVLMYETALHLSQSVVAANMAERGGGVFLDSTIVFNAKELNSSVVGNTAIGAGNDLSTNPTSLEVVGSRYISRFVAGSDEDAGLLPVRLRLSGHNGLIPCGFQRVEAYWQSSLPGTASGCQLPFDECAGSAGIAVPKQIVMSLQKRHRELCPEVSSAARESHHRVQGRA